jgi:hypothetical protein
MLVSAAVNQASRPRPKMVAAAPTKRAVLLLIVSVLKLPVARVFISQKESLRVRSLAFESCSMSQTMKVEIPTMRAKPAKGTRGLER